MVAYVSETKNHQKYFSNKAVFTDGTIEKCYLHDWPFHHASVSLKPIASEVSITFILTNAVSSNKSWFI